MMSDKTDLMGMYYLYRLGAAIVDSSPFVRDSSVIFSPARESHFEDDKRKENEAIPYTDRHFVTQLISIRGWKDCHVYVGEITRINYQFGGDGEVEYFYLGKYSEEDISFFPSLGVDHIEKVLRGKHATDFATRSIPPAERVRMYSEGLKEHIENRRRILPTPQPPRRGWLSRFWLGGPR